MIDERSMILVGASLLAIKAATPHMGSPASWLLQKQGVPGGTTQCGHSLANAKAESQP
jgi:hypothetical protein